MDAELKHAHRCANNCLTLVGFLFGLPGPPDADQSVKIMRALPECVKEAESIPEDVLLELSVAAGNDYVDLSGNPHRSAHEAAIALGRNTIWKIVSVRTAERTGDNPEEMRLKMRLGPDEARKFHERYKDTEPIQREIRMLKHGVEREAIALGANQHTDPAFRPATEILKLLPEIGSHKKLGNFLNRHPEISTHKPTPQRKLIHIGEFLDVWWDEEEKKLSIDKLSPEAVDALEEEFRSVERRKAEIQERNRGL